jgi:hypothetical protein
MTRHVVLALLLLATPAAAQQLEVTPLVAYTTAGAIDATARGVETLDVSGGFTWGAQVAYFISEHLGFEALWTRQGTDVTMSTS